MNNSILSYWYILPPILLGIQHKIDLCKFEKIDCRYQKPPPFPPFFPFHVFYNKKEDDENEGQKKKNLLFYNIK